MEWEPFCISVVNLVIRGDGNGICGISLYIHGTVGILDRDGFAAGILIRLAPGQGEGSHAEC